LTHYFLNSAFFGHEKTPLQQFGPDSFALPRIADSDRKFCFIVIFADNNTGASYHFIIRLRF
jgi:hypothetical protein